MAEKQFGSIKRFGARYGRTVKHNLAKIEKQLRTFQKCPYCYAKKAKRVANGIWECRKCGAKFTGKAYTVGGKLKPAEQLVEEALPEVKEVAEEPTERPKKKPKKEAKEEPNDEV